MWVVTISEFFSSAGSIVILAAAFQAVAYLFSSQIPLRLFLLAGTFLYLLYYFVAADDPLWPAIFGTGCIGATSIYGFLRALAYRSKLTISKAHLPIYERMSGIEPGAFRKLMKHAQIETFESQTCLTEVEKIPSNVYYTLAGDVEVTKGTKTFSVPAFNFIGEISIIGGFAATATVQAIKGTKAVVWDRKTLMDQMQRDERFRIAVEALFAKDMAFKLARAAHLD